MKMLFKILILFHIGITTYFYYAEYLHKITMEITNSYCTDYKSVHMIINGYKRLPYNKNKTLLQSTTNGLQLMELVN